MADPGASSHHTSQATILTVVEDAYFDCAARIRDAITALTPGASTTLDPNTS